MAMGFTSAPGAAPANGPTHRWRSDHGPKHALFGINAFAWQLPSAIAGTICVLLVFVLAIKLFDSAAISAGRRFHVARCLAGVVANGDE
ncbi:MAG: hypothetical protein R3E58_13560 [Phycisphaerae bacterium]